MPEPPGDDKPMTDYIATDETMRLTGYQCSRMKIQFLLNQARVRKYKYRERKFEIPQCIENAGISVIDPNKAFESAPRFPEWENPIKDDPQYSAPPDHTDHPDYHREPVFQFHDRVRFIEGVKQAQVLTKTVYREGLPSAVTANIGRVRLPRQDELVQRYIMQANVWDNMKKKIGRVRTPETPRNWKFKAETGIPRRRINAIFLQNMVRLCSQIQGASPELTDARQMIRDHPISTLFKRPENQSIHLHTQHEYYMTSKYPLPVYANEAETDDTAIKPLPDMFPLSPYIDLVKQHVYKEENCTGWHRFPGDLHPHTIFHTHDDIWLPHCRAAKMLMLTFAHCLSIAKAKYGEDVTQLPEPICAQWASVDVNKFYFMCFQLNTLDFHSDQGVKNIAWFDLENQLYEKVIPKRAMLRNTQYNDYDPEVFEKFLALYFTGTEPTGDIQQRIDSVLK